MRQIVFEYIEVDSNRTRRHSVNGYIRPEALEFQQVANHVSEIGGQDQYFRIEAEDVRNIYSRSLLGGNKVGKKITRLPKKKSG